MSYHIVNVRIVNEGRVTMGDLSVARGSILGVNVPAPPGADRFAILTHGLWTSRFGADPALVGRSIRLDGEAYDVVGATISASSWG